VISCLEILPLNCLSSRMNTLHSSLECKAGFFSQWLIWLFSLKIYLSLLSPDQLWDLYRILHLTIAVHKVTDLKRSPFNLTNDNINYALVFIFKPSLIICIILSFYFNAFEQESAIFQLKIQFLLSWRWNQAGEWSNGCTHSEIRFKKFMNI
jgi:hypothetical protein